MKADVTQPILSLSGEPVAQDATLRKVCTEALLGTLRGDDGLSGSEKVKLFSIALKIEQEDEPDLSVEDWAKVKERIGRAFGALIVGRAYEMIDAPRPVANGSAHDADSASQQLPS